MYRLASNCFSRLVLSSGIPTLVGAEIIVSDKSTKTLDWRYNRVGCSTCIKAQDFLDRHGIATQVLEDAKRKVYKQEKAWDLVGRVQNIYARKHTKTAHFKVVDGVLQGSHEDFLEMVLGPTGNLRAPILLSGKDLLVGFDEAAYTKVLL